MLLGHALKNAAVPIVTMVGIGIALLIGGAVVTETVFAIPGIGRLTVDAILRRDYPIIQGVILLFSAAYVLINLRGRPVLPVLRPADPLLMAAVALDAPPKPVVAHLAQLPRLRCGAIPPRSSAA